MSRHNELKKSHGSPENPYSCHYDYYYCAEIGLAQVPFQWEAEPGRSKQHTYGEDVNIYPLRPPPKLLSKKHAESMGWPLRPTTMSAHSSISSSVKEFFSSLVPRRRRRRKQQQDLDIPYKPLEKYSSSSPNNVEARGFNDDDDDDDEDDEEVGGDGNDSQASEDDFFSLRGGSPIPPPRKQYEYQHKGLYQTRDYQHSEYRRSEHHQHEYRQGDNRRSNYHQNGTLQEMLEAEWESTKYQNRQPIPETGFRASGAAPMDRVRVGDRARAQNQNRSENRNEKPHKLDEKMGFQRPTVAVIDRDRARDGVRNGNGAGMRDLAGKEKVSGRGKNEKEKEKKKKGKTEEPIRPRHRKSFATRIFAICGAP